MAFRSIDLHKPFNLDEASRASRSVHIKGLFLGEYAAQLKRLGSPWPTRIVPFFDYPGSDLVTMVSQLVVKQHSDAPLRRAIHNIAAHQFPQLRESLIGKVVFGVLGENIRAVLAIAAKGYAISSSDIGPVVVREVTDHSVRVELAQQVMPIEGWHSGVFAGVAASLNKTVSSLAVDLVDEFNGQLEMRWD